MLNMIPNTIKFFLLLNLSLLTHQLTGQADHTGFWEVKEVRVGGEVKAPVAKWTRINADGSFQSGNGWLQNSEGTWTFDNNNKTYLPVETNGILDEYGAFKVSFKDKTMLWERKEEGDRVIVTLQRIDILPKSTADHLVGIWDLDERIRNGKSEKSTYDPQDKFYLFIRWDRMYVERTIDDKKVYGYWHIHGHKPEVKFISIDGKAIETWTVEVDQKKLKMVGGSTSNKDLELMFSRMNKFPE